MKTKGFALFTVVALIALMGLAPAVMASTRVITGTANFGNGAADVGNVVIIDSAGVVTVDQDLAAVAIDSIIILRGGVLIIAAAANDNFNAATQIQAGSYISQNGPDASPAELRLTPDATMDVIATAGISVENNHDLLITHPSGAFACTITAPISMLGSRSKVRVDDGDVNTAFTVVALSNAVGIDTTAGYGFTLVDFNTGAVTITTTTITDMMNFNVTVGTLTLTTANVGASDTVIAHAANGTAISQLTLNGANATAILSTIGTGAITALNVSADVDSQTIIMRNGNITTLTTNANAAERAVNIYTQLGGTIGTHVMVANETLHLTSNGTKTLTVTNGIDMNEATSRIVFEGAGLTVSKIDVTANVTDGASKGLDVNASATVASLTHAAAAGDLTIDVLTGVTLTNSGAWTLADNTLVIRGAGTITASHADGLNLNNDASILTFQGTALISKVTASAATSDINFTDNGQIQVLVQSANTNITVGANGGTIWSGPTVTNTLNVAGTGRLFASGGINLGATGIYANSAAATVSKITITGSGAQINPGANLTVEDSIRIAGAYQLLMTSSAAAIVRSPGIAMGTAGAYLTLDGSTGGMTINRVVNTVDNAATGKGIIFANTGVIIDTVITTEDLNIGMTAAGTISNAISVADSDAVTLEGTAALTGRVTLAGTTSKLRFRSGTTASIDKVTTTANIVPSANNGILFDGGTVDTLNISGGDLSINAGSGGGTLTADVSIGAGKLSLFGSGLLNTSGNITLANATSALDFQSGINVQNVSVTADITDGTNTGIIFNATGASVINLTSVKNVTINANTNGTIGTGPSIAAGKTLTIRGNGNISTSTTVATLNAGDAKVRLLGRGTVAKLTFGADATVASTNGILFDSVATVTTIEFGAGSSKGIINSGTGGGTITNALTVGADSLFLYGTGTLTTPGAIVLNDADALLKFQDQTRVTKVTTATAASDTNMATGSAGGIMFAGAGAITTLDPAVGVHVNLQASASIDSIDLNNVDMTIRGNNTTLSSATSGANVQGTGGIILTNYWNGTALRNVTVAKVKTAADVTAGTGNGIVFQDHGHTVSAVTTGKDLTIELKGSGTISGSVAAGDDRISLYGTTGKTLTTTIAMDSITSQLNFAETGLTVSTVTVARDLNESGATDGIIFTASGTITTITPSADVTLSIAAGQTATLTNGLTLAATDTLALYGTGTVDAGTNKTITATATDNVVHFKEAATLKDLKIGAADTAKVKFTAAGTLSDTVTFAGNTVFDQGANSITLTTLRIKTTANSDVIESGSGSITMATGGEIILSGNLDLVGAQWIAGTGPATGLNQITKLIGTGQFSIDKDWTPDGATLTQLGSAAGTLTFNDTSRVAVVTIPNTFTYTNAKGTIKVDGNDTLTVNVADGQTINGTWFGSARRLNMDLAGNATLAGSLKVDQGILDVTGLATKTLTLGSGTTKGAYIVDGDTLRLDVDLTTAGGATNLGILRMTAGRMMGSDSTGHTINATNIPETQVILTGGTLQNIDFTGRIVNGSASAGTFVTGYGITLFVSPTGLDTNPGTQASPMQTVQAAVDSVTFGGFVQLLAGTYTLGTTVNVTKDMVIRGIGNGKTPGVLFGGLPTYNSVTALDSVIVIGPADGPAFTVGSSTSTTDTSITFGFQLINLRGQGASSIGIVLGDSVRTTTISENEFDLSTLGQAIVTQSVTDTAGLGADTAKKPVTDSLLVQYNVFTKRSTGSVAGSGVIVKGKQDVVIDNNLFKDDIGGGSTTAAGIVLTERGNLGYVKQGNQLRITNNDFQDLVVRAINAAGGTFVDSVKALVTDGNNYSTDANIEYFAAEEKILHRLDDGVSGTVQVSAANNNALYVPYTGGATVLQNAINNVTSTGTVNVQQGTYAISAPVTIPVTKSGMTLQGRIASNQATASEATTGAVNAPKLVVESGYAGNVLVLSADNVNVRGMEINTQNNGTVNNAIALSSDSSFNNILITKNTIKIESTDIGISIGDGATAQDLDVSSNVIKTLGGGTGWALVVADDGTVTSDSLGGALTEEATITSNSFSFSGIALNATRELEDVQINSNTFDHGNGIKVTAPSNDAGLITRLVVGTTGSGNLFKGGLDYALLLDSTLVKANFRTNINTDVKFEDNQVFAAAGGKEAVANNVAGVTTAGTDGIDAENNWWDDVNGPNNAGADISANVDASPYKQQPSLSASQIVVSAVPATVVTGQSISLVVNAGFDGAVEFATNFQSNLPDGPQPVVANAVDSRTTQLVTVIAEEVKTGAKITVFKAGGAVKDGGTETSTYDISASTNEFTINPGSGTVSNTEITAVVVPTEVIESVTTATTQQMGMPFWVKIVTNYTGAVTLAANQEIGLPTGPQMVSAGDTLSVQVIANELKPLKIYVYNADNTSVMRGSMTVQVSAPTIGAPMSLDVTDFPGDAGGNLLFEFKKSENHPNGGTGGAGTYVPVDYYIVKANNTNTAATAVNWAIITAEAKTASDSMVYAVVPDKGVTGDRFFWVAAVHGDMLPGVSTVVMGKEAVVEGPGIPAGIQMALAVEEPEVTAAVETGAEVAVAEVGTRYASVVSNSNIGRSFNNAWPLRADLNEDGSVEIFDVAIIAGIFGNADEYEPVVDLNANGEIDIFDVAVIAGVFGQSVSGKDGEVMPVVLHNDGPNTEVALMVDDFKGAEVVGEEVTLNLNLANVQQLMGYQFTVTYDPAAFELKEVLEGGLLAGLVKNENGEVPEEAVANEQTLFILNDKEPGRIVVGGILYGNVADNAVTGTGIIAAVTLRYLGGNPAVPVQISDIRLMDVNGLGNVLDGQAIENVVALPTEYALGNNYPNPFNPTTRIQYALPANGQVQMVIFNLLGQKIKTLVNGEMQAGRYVAEWDGTNDHNVRVASGVYIYRIQAAEFTKAKKMVLVK